MYKYTFFLIKNQILQNTYIHFPYFEIELIQHFYVLLLIVILLKVIDFKRFRDNLTSKIREAGLFISVTLIFFCGDTMYANHHITVFSKIFFKNFHPEKINLLTI